MLKQVLAITKTELKSLLNFNVILKSKDKRQRFKASAYIVISIIALVLLGIQISSLTSFLVDSDLEYLISGSVILVTFETTLFFSMYFLNSQIFVRKMHSDLMAMPIDIQTVISARVLKVYISYLILNAVIMAMHLICLELYLDVSIKYYLVAFLYTLASPLIPLGFSIIFMILNVKLASLSKHFDFVYSILSALSVIIVMALPALNNGINYTNMQEVYLRFDVFFKSTYPVISLVSKKMYETNIVDMIIVVMIAFAFFLIATLILVVAYRDISNKLNSLSVYKSREYNGGQKNPWLAIAFKEKYHYMSSPIYLSNTMTGMVIATVLSFILIFVDYSALENILNIQLADIFIIVWTGIALINNPCAYALSIEGKTVWQLKTMPISLKDFLAAKITFNLALISPFLLLSIVATIIAFKPTIVDFILQLMIAVLLIICISAIAINADLHFAKFNWNNEEEIVKQSIPSMINALVCVLTIMALMSIMLFIPVPVIYRKLLTIIVLIIINFVEISKFKQYDLADITN